MSSVVIWTPPRNGERERAGAVAGGLPFFLPSPIERFGFTAKSEMLRHQQEREALHFLNGREEKRKKTLFDFDFKKKKQKTKEFFAPEKWTWACDVSSYNFLAGHEETLHRNLFLVVVVVFSTASEKPSRLDYRRALGPQVGDNFRFHFISSFLIIFVGWEPNPRVGVVETRSEIYM